MFGKILIANRGEIALRILRACRELDIKTIVAHSETDRAAGYVKRANQSLCIGPAPASLSYLNIPAILSAAVISDAEAIHPGYGFLSCNADFAARIESEGLAFIGPRPETLRLINDKLATKAAMKAAGLPCVPGSDGTLPDEPKEILRIAKKIGYPVILKAVNGHGERGMRVVNTEAGLLNAVTQTRAEAQKYFGSSDIFLEKHLENPRCVEIQMLADSHGNVVHLGDRDCSLQRRYHKLIEEAPAPGVPNRTVARIGERCAEACRRIGYRGLGSFKFLVQDGEFYFNEIDAGLPIEHPLCEMVSGLDLVQEQIRIAAGEKLRFRQRDLNFRGHAIECRINAEDPFTFLPSPGKITCYHPPGGPGIRVDTHIRQGDTVSPHYDPLVVKIIAFGENREQAIRRMRNALAEMRIDGIKTTLPLHQDLLHDANFVKGGMNIHYLEKKLAIKSTTRKSD